jgi:hypothetical protein
MVTPKHILAQLAPVAGQQVPIVVDQDTDDIVKAVISRHNKFAPDYDRIAPLFWKGSAKRTAEELFNFVKTHIPYKAESQEHQTVKSPAAIVYYSINGKKHDCKHYASFIVGVAKALHRLGHPINAHYVFASDYDVDYPTHVFAEIWDTNTGTAWWCDPVLDTFNEDHHYYYILKNKKMLSEISGARVGLSFNINKPFGDVGEFVKKTVTVNAQNANKALKTNVENAKKGANIVIHDVKQGAQNTIDKGERVLAVPTLAASRNAFLLLVQLNVSDVAGKFMSLAQSEEGKAKIANLWYKLGGNWSSLKHAINSGWKRSGRSLPPSYHYIGEPASGSVAAALAAAVPVITAFAALFKELNITFNKGSIPVGANQLVEDHNKNGGTTPDGTVTTVTTDENGNKVLVVDKFKGNTYDYPPGILEDQPTSIFTIDPKTGKEIPGSDKWIDKTKNWVADHKTELEWGVGIAIGLALLSRTKAVKKLFK